MAAKDTPPMENAIVKVLASEGTVESEDFDNR